MRDYYYQSWHKLIFFSLFGLNSVVFFPEVGGSTLDSHHGFVVEYGMDRDVEVGMCLLILLLVSSLVMLFSFPCPAFFLELLVL